MEENEGKLYISVDKETGYVTRIDSVRMTDSKVDVIEQDGDIQSGDVMDLMLCRYVDGKFVKDENLEAEQNKNNLRTKRAPLLTAFDIYKSNLIVGAIEATEEEKAAVISWYKKILDLDEEAIENPPDLVKQYINE
jgi:hypothetical protein